MLLQNEPTTIWMFPKIVVPPKSSILIGFSIINYPFWGTTIFGKSHIVLQSFFLQGFHLWSCNFLKQRISHSRWPLPGFCSNCYYNSMCIGLLSWPSMWQLWTNVKNLHGRTQRSRMKPKDIILDPSGILDSVSSICSGG